MHSLRSFPSPLVAIGAGATLLACGGFDPGTPYRTRPIETADGTDPALGDEDGDGIDDGEGDGGVASFVPPGGTSDGPDASRPTAFTGAGAYAARTGPATRKAAHDFAGNTPTTNPAGRPCLQCHGAAGPAPRFAFGGTIYKDATGTPAPQVQVRVIGDDGVARTAFTNGDGNFFFPASSGAVKFPALAGARDANTTEVMTTTATNGNCNSCHRAGGTTLPLVVE